MKMESSTKMTRFESWPLRRDAEKKGGDAGGKKRRSTHDCWLGV